MRCLAVVIVLHSATAFACRDVDPEDPGREFGDESEACARYHPWSWVPLASAAGAYTNDVHGQGLFAGELRIRHGGFEDPDAWTGGLEVSTTDFASLAVAALVGHDFVDDVFGMAPEGRLAYAIHAAVGGGYDDATHRAFGTGRLAFGLRFAVADGSFIETCAESGDCEVQRFRQSAELDLVLQLRVDEASNAQLSLGVAFDPIRIWHEAAGYF